MKVFALPLVLICVLLLTSITASAGKKTLTETDVRRIVAEVLQEKDQEIARLKQKVQQLENAARETEKKTVSALASAPETAVSKTEATSAENPFNSLRFTGFFNLNAQTDAKGRDSFDFQALELHLEYLYDEHFGANAALAWESEGGANIGSAVIDYHWFDDRIPPRGRIFQNQGFHIQAGRFDLPFGIDYQYFAAQDRINITAPFTTERIQEGGFKENGFRSYGSWDMWNYSVFWTTPVYENKGTAAGGRLGMALGKHDYKMHYRETQNAAELGVSMLADIRQGEARSYVYGADLNLHYDMWQLSGEVLWRTGHELNEYSYYAMLGLNLQNWLQQSLTLLARYETWHPDKNLGTPRTIPRFTVGLNYHLNDYLYIKLEYLNTLGKMLEDENFEKSAAKAQLVVNF